ncbi:hypothetical protein [Arcanobacterium hippocoleae]|uniref:Uncharacterized protein n=1 Tax=Arcanobacterium hippocoleae TaxID=149017 RepID=A0ABU1T388_9ACTO|nr:hypothetical protein [Arcanobacterium hippocoleae]MDR6939315.1 hypothetical protein [Arcanobacterium hippocoleae]
MKITNRFTFFITSQGIKTFEMYVKPVNSHHVHVKSWINGIKSVDQITPVPSNSSFSKSATPMWIDWGNLNNCLSKLGISSWVLAGLGLVCGVACAGTAGLGCIGCVSFAAGFGAGSVKACVQKSWK